jgi:site-specific recombinase XerD
MAIAGFRVCREPIEFNTRRSCATDLMLFAAWCREGALSLFTVRRAHLELFALARRVAPSTQDTYRRDLDKYILPRFGAYRLGRLPADEIENWLNDEVAAGLAASSVHRHYRTLRRVLQVAVDATPSLGNS